MANPNPKLHASTERAMHGVTGKLDPKTVVLLREKKIEGLDKLAAEINERWHTESVSSTEARIEIGRMLIKAKKEVDADPYIGWDKWCELHIERSRSDIYKVMALANADKPVAALEEERARRRKEMAELRAKSSPQPAASTGDTITTEVSHVGDVEGEEEDDTGLDEFGSAAVKPPPPFEVEIALDVPLDNLCFSRFREEARKRKRVIFLTIPRTVNEVVQVEAIKHLWEKAMPGARTQFRQFIDEPKTESAESAEEKSEETEAPA